MTWVFNPFTGTFDSAGSTTYNITNNPGGSATEVQYNTGGAFGGSVNLTWVSPALTIGEQQVTQGSLVLANTAAAAYSVTLKSSNSATAAWTMTLPVNAGTNGQVLQTNGAGVTSWVAQSGGSGTLTANTTATSGFTAGQYLYSDGSLLQAGSFGTGVATALAVNAGSAGCFVRNNTAESISGALTLTSAAPQLTLGVNATTLGQIKLFGSTSGDVTLKPAAAAGTATVFQLPASNGNSGEFLQTDGAGGTSWAVGGGGLTIGTTAITGGTAGRLLFEKSDNTVTESSLLSFDSTNGSLSVGGATVTTSNPVLNLTQTWNAAVTFTGLKLNVTDTSSNTASLLLDLQVGGTSKAGVQKDGLTYNPIGFFNNTSKTYGIEWLGGGNSTIMVYRGGAASLGIYPGTTLGLVVPFNASYGFASSSTANANSDTLITRAAAATFQLGAADAAAPVAQTLQVQSATGSPNVAGANFTINGSRGTGSGAGGSIIFQVAPAGTGGGTTPNPLATVLTISSDKKLTLNGGVFDYGVTTASVFNLNANTQITSGSGWVKCAYIQNAADTAECDLRTASTIRLYGGANSFAVVSTGAQLASTKSLAWTSSTDIGTADTFLTRSAAATIQFGAADAAAPVAQTLQVQSVVGGTSDTAGAAFTIQGSRGTGTGAGGSIIFKTAPAGSSGTSQNTAIDRQIIVAAGKSLTDNTATSLFEIALPTLSMAGGVIEATVICTDGTDMQSVTETITYSAVNKGGAYTKDVDVQTTSSALSAGTLSNTWAFLDGTNKVTMQLTSDTSLSPTKFLVYYKVHNNSEQATTIV